MGLSPDGPRCLAPMRYSTVTEDPDPRCHRPAGHDAKEPATRASLRHLSRIAYDNEKARVSRNRGRYR